MVPFPLQWEHIKSQALYHSLKNFSQSDPDCSQPYLHQYSFMTFFPTIKIKFNCPFIQLSTSWLCYSLFPKFFLWFWLSVHFFFSCYIVSPQKQGPRFQQRSCSINVYWIELSIRHVCNEVDRFVWNYIQTRECHFISGLGNRFQLMADAVWIVANSSIAMRRIPGHTKIQLKMCHSQLLISAICVQLGGGSVLYIFHSCWKKIFYNLLVG